VVRGQTTFLDAAVAERTLLLTGELLLMDHYRVDGRCPIVTDFAECLRNEIMPGDDKPYARQSKHGYKAGYLLRHLIPPERWQFPTGA
jgi:hypothetical protein